MRIHSLQGDITELGPTHFQLMGLWVRGGFNGNFGTWQDIRAKYPGILLHDANPDRPWLNAGGATFDLSPADNLLQYIQVLPNPTDAFGEPNLLAIGATVGRVLDAAMDMGVRKLGFIHIPVSFNGRNPTEEENKMSAGAMIGALGKWDAAHPNRVTDVFLVDHGGRFGPFVDLGGLPRLFSQRQTCLSNAISVWVTKDSERENLESQSK